MESTFSGKPRCILPYLCSCTLPCVSAVTPMLHSKQLQCWSIWGSNHSGIYNAGKTECLSVKHFSLVCYLAWHDLSMKSWINPFTAVPAVLLLENYQWSAKFAILHPFFLLLTFFVLGHQHVKRTWIKMHITERRFIVGPGKYFFLQTCVQSSALTFYLYRLGQSTVKVG